MRKLRTIRAFSGGIQCYPSSPSFRNVCAAPTQLRPAGVSVICDPTTLQCCRSDPGNGPSATVNAHRRRETALLAGSRHLWRAMDVGVPFARQILLWPSDKYYIRSIAQLSCPQSHALCHITHREEYLVMPFGCSCKARPPLVYQYCDCDEKITSTSPWKTKLAPVMRTNPRRLKFGIEILIIGKLRHSTENKLMLSSFNLSI